MRQAPHPSNWQRRLVLPDWPLRCISVVASSALRPEKAGWGELVKTETAAVRAFVLHYLIVREAK